MYSSRKSGFFSFRRNDFFFIFSSRIIVLISIFRGKAKVLEGLGYLLFTILFMVFKGEAKVLEGLGYPSIIVNRY
jgi:hypothetical protein